MWDLSSFLQLRCIRILGKYHAGFKSIEDGHFTEVMLIKSNEDERRLKQIYDIETVKKEY